MQEKIKSIKKQFAESIEIKNKVKETLASKIAQVAMILADCLKKGNKILLCGNGGSAADAQHLAAELMVRLRANSRNFPLPAIALSTDTSVLTACANDFGFENIFSRQIQALGKKGDCLVAISTSGKSENIILAAKQAKKLGIKVIGFLGKDGGKLAKLVDYPLFVPSNNIPRIQEAHTTIGHIILELVEKEFIFK
ncbi:MAG: D-sedoheptulose 7-phosphate isomerase [candidate division Zixibacteria bacterium]|nr:D-sedoheptulose 7-phosphate isomerase [candidate division Zixibacteria bacterium]